MRRSDAVPNDFAKSVACRLPGIAMKVADFCERYIATGLVELNDRGRVTRESLERRLGHLISAEQFLAADQRRDAAREYQRRYRQTHEGNHARF